MTSQKQKREREKQAITSALIDAHSTELFTASSLAAHIAMTPDSRYRDGLEAHLVQTKDHAQRIQRHLRSRNSERNLVQLGFGVAQGVASQVLAMSKVPVDLLRGMTPEEMLVRNARDECAAEAFEVATYTALEQLARQVGDTQTEQLAASIRKDEEAMLQRLLNELPRLATDVVTAEVNGNGQFVGRRIGAFDAARTVAGMAARSLGRGASRTARTVETDGPAKPKARRPVRKPATTTTTRKRKAAGTRSTTRKRPTTSKRATTSRGAKRPTTAKRSTGRSTGRSTTRRTVASR